MEAQYKYGLCKGANGKKALVKNGMFAEGTTCGRIFCDKERFRSFNNTIMKIRGHISKPKKGVLRLSLETKSNKDDLYLQKWRLRLEQTSPNLPYWYYIAFFSRSFPYHFLSSQFRM